MGRREEKREATRQDILTAALSLFVDCGYDETSVDTITEKANVAKGTFYYHFKSKEEVMMGLGLQYLRQMTDEIEKRINRKESPLIILRDCLRQMAKDTQDNKALSKRYYSISMSQQFEDAFKDDPAILPNVLARIVVAAQDVDEIKRDLNANELGFLISGTIQSAHMGWLARNEAELLTDKVDAWWQVLLVGLSTEKVRSETT